MACQSHNHTQGPHRSLTHLESVFWLVMLSNTRQRSKRPPKETTYRFTPLALACRSDDETTPYFSSNASLLASSHDTISVVFLVTGTRRTIGTVRLGDVLVEPNRSPLPSKPAADTSTQRPRTTSDSSEERAIGVLWTGVLAEMSCWQPEGLRVRLLADCGLSVEAVPQGCEDADGSRKQGTTLP